MRYCKHYKMMTALHGYPNLKSEQQNQVLNIISVELRIDEIEKVESIIRIENKELWKRKETLKDQLFSLTKYEAPYKWFENLVQDSLN